MAEIRCTEEAHRWLHDIFDYFATEVPNCFADMDLIGIPHRLVVGDKGLAKGVIEYKGRRDKQARQVALENIAGTLREMFKI